MKILSAMFLGALIGGGVTAAALLQAWTLLAAVGTVAGLVLVVAAIMIVADG